MTHCKATALLPPFALAASLLSFGCAHQLREKATVVSTPAPQVYHEPTIDDIVAEGADGSVEQAKREYGITLDYQPASVKKIDIILTKLHGQYVKDKNNDRWKMEGLGWGAYVGEVIRRQYGGHWEKLDDTTGNPLPLIWHNGTSFPVTWSIEQIVDGGSESIWQKYQAITSADYTRAVNAVKKT